MSWKNLAAAGCLIAALFCGGCVQEAPEVPRALVGAWITDDPRYEGCALIITGKTVLIKQKGGRELEHAIERVESGFEKQGIRFTFIYRDEYQDKLEMSLVYDPAGGGRLTFLNQPGFRWVRAGGAS